MTIRYEKDGHVATITIDNGKVNAFTPEMHKQLHDIMQEFMADRSVHVGILTGAGTKAFCAGDDIKTPNGVQPPQDALAAHFFPSTDEDTKLRPGWERELRKMERYKPIIGAINGPALGMGAIYLLNLTDIRIAAPMPSSGCPRLPMAWQGQGARPSWPNTSRPPWRIGWCCWANGCPPRIA